EGNDGFTDELAADLLDEMHKRLQRHLAVGKEIGASADALIGRDVDQQQRRHVDDAERILHGTGHRCDDGACLNALDGGRALAHFRFLGLFLTRYSTAYHRTKRGAAQSIATDSSNQRPACSAAKAMRWVWPGSIASVSSQNGFQPSSSLSSRRKGWPCRRKTVAASAGLVSASTPMRRALARKAGCSEPVMPAFAIHSGPFNARSARSAFLRSSRAGSPLDGSGGGGGSGAARAGGSRETMT